MSHTPHTHNASHSPPVRAPRVLLKLAQRVYLRELGKRNRRWDAGEGVVRPKRAVISVGNLSMGGTGKTPMVRHIVELLQQEGHRPCIAMRGYAPKRFGLLKGSGGEGGDEVQLYKQALGGVPVVAQPDRVAGLRELMRTPAGKEIDAIVLDDGFGHRRIARDVDLLLIDASLPGEGKARDPFADAVLPVGWLREPVEAMTRATAVVLTHCEHGDEAYLDKLSRQVREVTGREPIARAVHRWTGFRVWTPKGPRVGGVDGGARSEDWVKQQRVAVCCGIGNPGAFVAQVEHAAGEVAQRHVFGDHHAYKESDARRMATAMKKDGIGVLMTTEKDWVKLASVWPKAARAVFGKPSAQAGARTAMGGVWGSGGQEDAGGGASAWSRDVGDDWPGLVARPVLHMGFAQGKEALRAHVLGVFEKEGVGSV